MKLDTKDLKNKIQPALVRIRRDMVMIYILTVALIFGFLVFRINMLAQSEPSEAAVSEKLKGVKRPKIDQTAINKIQALQESNVEVQALFKQARDNPFQE